MGRPPVWDIDAHMARTPARGGGKTGRPRPSATSTGKAGRTTRAAAAPKRPASSPAARAGKREAEAGKRKAAGSTSSARAPAWAVSGNRSARALLGANRRSGRMLLARRALLGGTLLFGLGLGIGAGLRFGRGAPTPRTIVAPKPPRRPPPGTVTVADVPDASAVRLTMPMAEGASADVMALPAGPSRVVLPDPQIVTAARQPVQPPPPGHKPEHAATASVRPAMPEASTRARTMEPVPVSASVAHQPAMARPPAWLAHAVGVPHPGRAPMVAIVIDDLGLDRRRTAEVAALAGPLTLSFMAYAGDLPRQTAAGHAAGHELMVHMPMQPGDASIDPGPGALLVGQDGAEIRRRLERALAAFDGHVGLNNHMGSRFTAYPAGMRVVLETMRRRGLLFLDSRTTGGSVAPRLAVSTGVPFLERTIFLDHDPRRVAVEHQLAALERTASAHGHAVAIGHPRDATIGALRAWLPSARSRGFALVPASAVPRFSRTA